MHVEDTRNIPLAVARLGAQFTYLFFWVWTQHNVVSLKADLMPSFLKSGTNASWVIRFLSDSIYDLQ